MLPRATIDYETRSAFPLKAGGSWRYSLDPTTEPLCMAYRLPHWERDRVALWHPAFPHLGLPEHPDMRSLFELFQWIEKGGLVEAHNAFFERGIWTNIMVPRFDWPIIEHHRWRCTAARAAALALPRHLADVGVALKLDALKDDEGHRLMLKVSKPRKPLKAEVVAWGRKHAPCGACLAKGKVKVGRMKATPCERCKGAGYLGKVPPMPLLWHETLEQFKQLWAYCEQDVLAEEALSRAIPDLSHLETDTYLLDQRINVRGFQIDREAVDVALELVQDETHHLNQELTLVTDEAVTKATQRARMTRWLESKGVYLEDTQASTIEKALKDPDSLGEGRRALEILQALGKSSTAKYEAMRNWMCPDGRVRGGLLYHGASTGRWSGAGVQPHNFPRGSIKDMEGAWKALKSRDRTQISVFGPIMDLLSQALRGAITAGPGNVLYVADFAAIEARVLLWLAEDEAGLDIFRRHEDIYADMAGDIYKRHIDKKKDPVERQLGKAAILGLGYQMGPSKFVDTALSYGVDIDEDFAQRVVDTYRERFYRVKEMWWAQEAAAIRAAKREGVEVECGYVTWEYEKPFLYCTLPSGRRLAYPEPEVRKRDTPWGEKKDALTSKGINPFNHQWERQATYGGKLVENITQAVARDLMAEAMVRCEGSGIYVPVLSVHDEMIAEAKAGTGDVKVFETLMSECPDWARGCPIEAEGWSGFRYRK